MKKLILITITSVCLLSSLILIKSIISSSPVKSIDTAKIQNFIKENSLSKIEQKQLEAFKTESMGVLTIVKKRTLSISLELQKYINQTCRSGLQHLEEIGFTCKVSQSLISFSIEKLK